MQYAIEEVYTVQPNKTVSYTVETSVIGDTNFANYRYGYFETFNTEYPLPKPLAQVRVSGWILGG